ncbi:MAG: hypothetical protein ACD_29C00199G0002 [uncultured bacterium]|nr:MAG: hypothetical protein ACD_29C00199G0002 [uncultured bacterium]
MRGDEIQRLKSTDAIVIRTGHAPVKIYEKTPMHYQVIGSISADNYSLIGMEYSQDSLMRELKKQAASIGANGVMHIHQGLTQTTAEAVFIK